ncbi:Zn-dependent oligopeptidase [Methanoplanus sp. FWC-SCC4]|uniref:Zn-dependent oligopeptidase n=1 Tax=Methanochimaera problematica TaxID=2609417 RepID=A0AA97F9A2_9EURY|nr:M3 family metallopeptidase [Methanoplanus sp. FWC-SCC4]WOF15170.1 Zn-dependent oligopeptidase [Methanoplanus sp. FWC-SCC4]
MQSSDYKICHYSFSCIIVLTVIFLMTAGCLQNTRQDESTDVFVPGPDSPIQTHYSYGEITQLRESAEQTANASLNAITDIAPEKRNFENTVIAFDSIMNDYSDSVIPLIAMGNVYPDAKIAEEGMKSAESYYTFDADVYTRRDLYNALKSVNPRNPQESRLYDVIIREFEHNGLNLPDERLLKVREMKQELSALESQFSANLNNDNTTIQFSPDDLRGVPESSLNSFSKTPKSDYIVTMKSPDYNAIMKYAENSETRRRMYEAKFNIQGEANTALLEEAIVLREKIAKELGYPTWADYKIDKRMAVNSSNVMEFLTSLKEPLKEKTKDETDALLLIKQRTDASATEVRPWDISYLEMINKKELYGYDEEELKEYLPLDSVLNGIFNICGSLFGVDFTEVEDAQVWHPDVRLYKVEDQTDGATIGYLYLDLYPREGKYGHFCASRLITGRMVNGTYNTPVCAIIGNFDKPEGDRPSLLTIPQMYNLFHETGHAMHFLLTKAPYGTMSGFNVEMDFVETPSQALEEWAWDPEILKSVSAHYKNPSEKMPDEIIEKAISSRNAGNGYYYSRLLARSLEDMYFSSLDSPVNTTAVWYETYEDTTGLKLPDGIHDQASFGHLMGGYDAGYYGYLWSKVYALNIVDEFKENGMTNRTLGMKFRNEILEKGNMEDGNVLLKNFLGREPGPKALYEYIGIETSS